MVTAAECKAKGQVLYNGGCQRRGNSCNGGKGYLGQVAANNGWGVCINFGTRAPKTTTPKQYNCDSACTTFNALSLGLARCGACSKETLVARTQTNKCPPQCDNLTVVGNPACGGCTREQLLARGPGIGSSGGGSKAPGGSADPKRSKSPGGCNECSPVDIGCQMGKQFCEFQNWLLKSAGNIGLPAVAVVGTIVLLLAIKR